MQPFLHEQLQKFEALLEASNEALRSHSADNLDTADVVIEFLERTSVTYHGMGYAEAENEMLALMAEFNVARRGLHPLTLEHVATRRRQMERSIALRVLRLSAERLRADCSTVRQALTETKQRLAPIALYAVQRGLITPGPDHRLTQQELEQLWHALLQDSESQGATRQVGLTVGLPDIVLVLGDLLGSLA